MPTKARSEGMLITLVALVQFLNIVNFMMVAPLGPDLARGIDLPTSAIGAVAGSYTLAAAVGSLLAANWLDRLDRRLVTVLALGGQAVGTLAAAASWDMASLIAARAAGGIFAGPATSTAIAIVMDAVPPHRRGKAMGTVMGAFAAASVLGVPAGLELAHIAGWQAPFLVLGTALLGLAAVAAAALPRLRAHITADTQSRLVALFQRREPTLAFAMIVVSVTAGFLLIPNLSTFYQLNMGYPRDSLSLLYLVGGSVSFFTMRLAGNLTDRLGALTVAVTAGAAYQLVAYGGFVVADPWLPVMGLFVAFMVCRSSLGVSVNTLITQVPWPRERAAFMSLKTAVQHLAGATGAFLSSRLLDETAGGALIGMPLVASLSMILAATQPLLMAVLVRRLKATEPPE
jgi:predicted MFS family arabinose efflux permease